ncbi:MAG TPA: SAM-dependent chlorinase/fluorinase, partial [Bacteroidia bacterium]|nr:SAM-dependent chlorinase/fluorinase [Bacteroidia bacterium]
MAVITLTTDFGLRDHYTGSLRGALLRQLPSATVIDISHQITPFDFDQAAYVLGHAYHEFPAGTIHLVAVGSGGGGKFPHVIVQLGEHFFIGCDNGMFSLLSDKNPSAVIELAAGGKEPSTFVARDLYVPAAAALANGTPAAQLGRALEDIQRRNR